MKILRSIRNRSLARAEAIRAAAHGGLAPAHSAIERMAGGHASHDHPGKIELMLMSGSR